jgi:hypothetical protein
MDAWWTNQQAGLWGGIGGGLFGLLGGVLGTLVGVYAPKGRFKSLVLGLQYGMIGVGAVSLVMGVLALSLHQPYAVWYPLTLLGLLMMAVCGGLLPQVLRTYRQAEQRRLDAQELRRG